MIDPLEIIGLLSEKVKRGFDALNVTDKYLETIDETLLDKVCWKHLQLEKWRNP